MSLAEIKPRTDSWPHYLSTATVANGRLIAPVTVRSGWSSKELLLAFIKNECKPIPDARGQDTRFEITASGAIEAIKARSERQSHVITVLTGLGGPQKATAEVGELDIPFDDYPKPTVLIKYFLQMNEGKDFISLDFFAGSGTSAHAVLDLNKQDGGNRKFILVQLPEPCAPDSTAYKTGFKTIADITKERVRRVIKKLNEEDSGKLGLEGAKPQDRGFKVFKLSESNFRPWNADILQEAGTLEKQLDLHVDHIRDGRTADDLLYELLLKSGYPLTAPVEVLQLAGKQVHSVAGGLFFVCLEQELTLELIRAMADKKPERVVCLDEGFAGNDQLKANAVQIFKTKGVTSFKTV
jgi:adenine-specific DNA-methyltransferase